eukprot:gene22594-biopygen8109
MASSFYAIPLGLPLNSGRETRGNGSWCVLPDGPPSLTAGQPWVLAHYDVVWGLGLPVCYLVYLVLTLVLNAVQVSVGASVAGHSLNSVKK